MGDHFYIVDGEKREGPFDLIAMIKKVRNGKLKPSAPVYCEGMDETMPACKVPALETFFEDMDAQADALRVQSAHVGIGDQAPDVVAMLKYGWAFLADHQTVALVSGGLVGAIVFLGLIVSQILPAFLSALMMVVLCTAGYFGFLIHVRRLLGLQPADTIFWKRYLKQHGKAFALVSAITGGVCFGVPAIIGSAVNDFGYLLLIPGSIILSLFVLAPLMMMDNANLTAKLALMRSKDALLQQGMDTVGVIAVLVFINLAAASALLLPLLVSLPVTSAALVLFYEEKIRK